MNMLADADLPEAGDEFSYREDPGLSSRTLRLAAARARYGATSNSPAMSATAEWFERLRHPLIPIPRTYDVAAENARIFAIRHPRSHNDAIGYRPYDFAPRVVTSPPDSVNHPSHYVDVVPGVECIDVTEHFSFLRGNAIKYLWRAGSKGDTLEDLRKAAWYIEREIKGLSS